jgi:hypothetical protein
VRTLLEVRVAYLQNQTYRAPNNTCILICLGKDANDIKKGLKPIVE